MRIKKFLILSFFTIILSNNVKSEDNQQLPNNNQSICLTEQDCMSLNAPIIFSKGGLTKFLQNVFNRHEYAQNVLPYDLSHFVQCLDFAQNRYQKRMHGHHVMRLFTHKLRAAPYVTNTAFLAMLDEISPIMSRYNDGAEQRITSSMKASINKILYDSFLAQFTQFKASPQTFFDALADDITVSLYDTQTLLSDIGIDEFKHSFTRFLELGLSKVVWQPQDGIKTWQSVLNISDRLIKMTEANMFDSDELYELQDTLLERYCFFLDVVTSDMPLAFFEELKSCITNKAIQLLDDDELELCLETRRQRLSRLLCECEFRLQANAQGFMVG
jgi:hypothetical protein